MPKLSTCICGAKPEVWDDDGIVWIQCPKCFRCIPGDTEEKAAMKWKYFIIDEKRLMEALNEGKNKDVH